MSRIVKTFINGLENIQGDIENFVKEQEELFKVTSIESFTPLVKHYDEVSLSEGGHKWATIAIFSQYDMDRNEAEIQAMKMKNKCIVFLKQYDSLAMDLYINGKKMEGFFIIKNYKEKNTSIDISAWTGIEINKVYDEMNIIYPDIICNHEYMINKLKEVKFLRDDLAILKL